MSITFYYTMSCDHLRPFMANVPVMLPASSWSRIGMKKPKLPAHVDCVAADSGGFVATFKWGDYRYNPGQYVDWLDTFRPQWAATMDYCCEDEITSGNAGIVRERQGRTSDMAYHFWREYRDAAWTWVVTLQGWTIEDYVRHARELKPLIEEMRRADLSHWRIGIGTLCRRASSKMVSQVVSAVAWELPKVPLHLWGVKLTALQSKYSLPQVVSVDSAAWKKGGMGRDGIFVRDEAVRLGLKQMEYAHEYELPAYKTKVDRALAEREHSYRRATKSKRPQQPMLW